MQMFVEPRLMRVLLLTCCVLMGLPLIAHGQMIGSIKTAELPQSKQGGTWEAIKRTQELAWRTNVSLKGENLPLADVLQQLSQQAGCPIDFPSSLPVPASTPVSIDVADLSLHSTLVTLLRKYELSYVAKQNEIAVISLERAGYQVMTRTYDVSGLFSEGHGPDSWSNEAYDAVSRMIDRYWYMVGLEGDACVNSFQGRLIVRQSPREHWIIEEILKRIQAAKELPSEPYPTEPLKVLLPHDKSEVIAKTLHDTRITWKKENASLEEIASVIQERTEVPVFVNLPKSHNTEISRERDPLSIEWNDLSVWEALDELTTRHKTVWRIVEDRIDLGYAYDSEMDSHQIRVYPIRDLVWYGLKLSPEEKSRLKALKPDSHREDENGNEVSYPLVDARFTKSYDYGEFRYGFYDVFPETDAFGSRRWTICDEADSILLATTLRNHAVVSAHLAKLRKTVERMSRQQLMTELDEADAKVITLSYEIEREKDQPILSSAELKKIAAVMQEEIATESWKDGKGYIVITPDQFVVRNRRDVQRRIIAMINEIRGLKCPFCGMDGQW